MMRLFLRAELSAQLLTAILWGEWRKLLGFKLGAFPDFSECRGHRGATAEGADPASTATYHQ